VVDVPPPEDHLYWQMIVELDQKKGDPDSYTRYNMLPSSDDYDFRDESSRKKTYTVVMSPHPGKWYIAIKPYSNKAIYNWKVLVTPLCKFFPSSFDSSINI